MKQILKSLTIKLFALGLLAAPIAVTSSFVVNAQDPIQGGLCQGADKLQFGGTTDCAALEEDSTSNFNELITDIINIFSIIVGIIAVIMIIIGGFRYIISGGDSGNVTAAKNTILYALVGLIIVALAQFIVRFVLSKAAETA